MKNNEILDGWLDGWKLKIKKSNIYLTYGKNKLDIKDKIVSVQVKGGEYIYSPDYMTCIVTFKNDNNYFIDKKDNTISGVILVDFDTYLKLLVYGAGIPPVYLGL